MNSVQLEQGSIFKIFELIKTDEKFEAEFQHIQDQFTPSKLEDLERQEAELLREVESLQLEEDALQKEMLFYLQDRSRLEMNEDNFWDRANNIEKENIELEEESSYTRQQTMFFSSELERLSKIYMLNEVFDIKYDKDMATISKLHMGQYPDTGNINWDETNAGFGHLILLLNYLCVRNSIKVPNIQFEPLGNISSIKIAQKDGPSKECRLSGPPSDEVGVVDVPESVHRGVGPPFFRCGLYRE